VLSFRPTGVSQLSRLDILFTLSLCSKVMPSAVKPAEA